MMNRRDIFKTLAGMLAAVPLRAQGRQPRSSILLQESPLAGTQYYEAQRQWSQLKIGAPVRLVRAPANPYDPLAVEVWHGDAMLGHLPSDENIVVAQMLDRGERLNARIAALCKSPDPWERIRVQIHLDASKPSGQGEA